MHFSLKWFYLFLSTVTLFADTVKPNGSKGPVLCSSFPIYDGSLWHIEIGLLVEKVGISNLDVYYIQKEGSGTISNPKQSDKVRNVSFPMSVGIQAAIAKYFSHDDWVIDFSFEWLNSLGKANDNLSSSDLTVIPIGYDVWAGTADPVYDFNLKQANVSLNTNYFLLDIFLSRGSYFSNVFSYQPYAGLKTAWIYYNLKEAYFEPTRSTTLNDPLLSNEILKKVANTDYWGIGPMVGVNGSYYISYGWSFFSSSNLAILYGNTDISNRSGVVTTASVPANYMLTDNFYTFCPTLRNMIGIMFDKDSFCQTRHYNMVFGFDTSYYFNQYPFLQQASQPNIIQNNSYAMVGFVLKLALDF
jgi:hypothetical protein